MSGALHGVLASLKSAAAAATDAFFKYVTLLLHGDGTNGAQNNTFLDSSTNNFTVTRNGNTTQGSFSPFSQTGWSNYFDGTGDYLNVTSNTALVVGTGDYTYEFWVYQTSVSGSQVLLEVGRVVVGTTPGIQIDTINGLLNVYGGPMIATLLVTASTNQVVNTWYHIALTRQSGSTKLFVNGTQVGTTATDNTDYTSGHVWVGANGGGGSAYVVGYISNVRIVKGTAVYTSNFTPPTAPLTAITNTSLLTCQSNRFIDNSTNNFAITRNGDVRVEAFSPFNPATTYSTANVGGSGYFDGTGDYLAAPDDPAFEFGNGDYTVEAWVYLTGYSLTYQAVYFGGAIFAKNSSNSDLGFYLLLDGTTNSWTSVRVQQYYSGNTNESTTATYTFLLNTWYHIAATRSSGSVRIFINGIQSNTTATFTQTQTNTTASFTIGGQNFPNFAYTIPGYISGARVVKGTAVYTSNFTPPTAPLTAITNTSLLLNFTNGGIFDNASQTVVETVGNAQISTAQFKWGTGSLAFDGTGDWLLAPDRPGQRFGTGAFTIEMWVYRSASGTYGLVAKGTGTTGWMVSLNSSNQVVFTFATSTITSTGTVAATTWTHIAVVREGTGTNQTKIYIGGTNDGTSTVNTDFNQTNSLYIGADRTGGSNFNGYIDDLRITTGYARYTANFTPPTAAFPDQ